MEKMAKRMAGLVAISLLAACGTPPITIDTINGAQNDPVILSPGTKGMRGGPVRVPLPEFELDSTASQLLTVDADGEKAELKLEMSFGKLYAHVPQHSFELLAKVSKLPEVLFKALKDSSPRFRGNRPDAEARLALAMSLAERLPRHNSKLWNDAYNYDPAVRALALVPGMRVRLETMLPITADATRDTAQRSQGSVMPPSYLNVLQANNGAGVVLAPTLEALSILSVDLCPEQGGCAKFKNASGIHNLLGQGKALRFWSLFYPVALGGITHTGTPLAFVNENLTPRAFSVPAVLLVASSGPQDMSAFIAAAKARPSAQDETSIDCSIATGTVNCFILRYRVLPVPEILVTVQGVPVWVEIGTTLGMALAAHETVRTTASFAGEQFSAGDAWRNRQNRIQLEKIEFSRVHMGVRSRVVTQPHMDNPDEAIRRITLQAGDEIKWAN